MPSLSLRLNAAISEHLERINSPEYRRHFQRRLEIDNALRRTPRESKLQSLERGVKFLASIFPWVEAEEFERYRRAVRATWSTGRRDWLSAYHWVEEFMRRNVTRLLAGEAKSERLRPFRPE